MSHDTVLDRLRRHCLALPEATEAEAWGHPVFKVRKRTFAAFERVQGRPSIALRLTAAEVEALVGGAGFFPTPYGRGIWVSRWIDRAVSTNELERLQGLIVTAYRAAAGVRLCALLDGRTALDRSSRRPHDR